MQKQHLQCPVREHLYVTTTGSVPVGLVNNQPAHSAEGDAQRVPDVVDQATRRGDQDVDALTQSEDGKKEQLSEGLKDPRRTQKRGRYLAFSAFLFSPPIRTPGTIQVNGCRETGGKVSSSSELQPHPQLPVERPSPSAASQPFTVGRGRSL